MLTHAFAVFESRGQELPLRCLWLSLDLLHCLAVTELPLIAKFPYVPSMRPNHLKASVTIEVVERWNRCGDDSAADLSTVGAASVDFGGLGDDPGIVLSGPVEQIGRLEGSPIKIAFLERCVGRFSGGVQGGDRDSGIPLLHAAQEHGGAAFALQRVYSWRRRDSRNNIETVVGVGGAI